MVSQRTFRRNFAKKAFTITEMVVVIAVVAVLAAVAVPTFSHVAQNVDKNTRYERILSLNSALYANGGCQTMYEALSVAESAGFTPDYIATPTEFGQLVWDSVNNCFCYFDGQNLNYVEAQDEVTTSATVALADVVQTDFWLVADSPEDMTLGLSFLYTQQAGPLPETIQTGFDAGNVEGLTVNYVRSQLPAQKVTIRTNGGVLNVNAPADSIVHFGKADIVNIESIANTSFVEHGATKLANLNSGRYVVYSAQTQPQIFLQSQQAIVAAAENSLLQFVGRQSNVQQFTFQTVKAVAAQRNTFEVVSQVTVHINNDGTLAFWSEGAEVQPPFAFDRQQVAEQLCRPTTQGQVIAEIFPENTVTGFSVMFNQEEVSSLEVALDQQTLQLSVDNFSHTGWFVPTHEVTWSTTDENVATVQDGKVTLNGGGQATITAVSDISPNVVRSVQVSVVAVTDLQVTLDGKTCDDGQTISVEYPEDLTFNFDEAFCYNSQNFNTVVDTSVTYLTNGSVFSVQDGTLHVNEEQFGSQQVTVRLNKYNIQKTFTVEVKNPTKVSFVSALEDSDKYLWRMGNARSLTLGSLFQKVPNIVFSRYSAVQVNLYDAITSAECGTLTPISTLATQHFHCQSAVQSFAVENVLSQSLSFVGTGVVIVEIGCVRNGNFVQETACSLALEIVDGLSPTQHPSQYLPTQPTYCYNGKNIVEVANTNSAEFSLQQANVVKYGKRLPLQISVDGTETGSATFTSTGGVHTVTYTATDNLVFGADGKPAQSVTYTWTESVQVNIFNFSYDVDAAKHYWLSGWKKQIVWQVYYTTAFPILQGVQIFQNGSEVYNGANQTQLPQNLACNVQGYTDGATPVFQVYNNMLYVRGSQVSIKRYTQEYTITYTYTTQAGNTFNFSAQREIKGSSPNMVDIDDFCEGKGFA